jgi:two-component system, sensor histidine kinase and response regulator
MSQEQRDRPNRILLIAQQPSSLANIDELLRSQGYEVAIATNSDEALCQIERVAPDLVLVDAVMSEMDGYELCQRIHQNPALPVLPILLLTTDTGNVVRTVAAGSVDVILKEIAPMDLLARIQAILWLKQRFEQRYWHSQQCETAIADILHDVRMPLTAANQLLEEIQAGALGEMSAEIRAALAQITASNQVLLHLIETRLSIHQYEVGGMELNFFSVDLVELSASVIETLQPLAVRKGLDLRLIEGAEGLPEVLGDRLELQRLLTNLIDNAIRFTDVGSVQVQLTASVEAEGSEWVAIAISDTGIGIAEDEKIDLFERFRQGRPRRSGHGLGLHLCRQIAEAHHGKIEVQSALGQGSCFIVYLPRHRA